MSNPQGQKCEVVGHVTILHRSRDEKKLYRYTSLEYITITLTNNSNLRQSRGLVTGTREVDVQSGRYGKRRRYDSESRLYSTNAMPCL